MYVQSFISACLVAVVAAKFPYIGVNEAGPEFGDKNLPGTKGKDYVWPNNTSIDQFLRRGMNTFRINIMMERVIPGKMTGSLDRAYFQDLKNSVEYITKKNAYAMIVPHNYGRYHGQIISNPSNFEAFWKTLATPFADNPYVIFDTNNEYHDMDQSLVVRLNQGAINGIRASGAKQLIHVEGNSWTGAWTWVGKSQNGATMAALRDPLNKIVYQMHQYLDQDGSGTHEACVSSTIGVERIKDATQWLRSNRKIGYLGEFAAGDNARCKDAIKGMLSYMQKNSDVWSGWLWWSAGPWWGKYMFSMEPKDGKGFQSYLDLIMQYA